MFDIAWTEMLVIAIVLIVVVGPKELPGMLRTFGKTTARLRVMAGDFRRQFDEALKEAELDDLKKLADDARKLNPAGELKKALNPLETAGRDIRAGLEAAFNPPRAEPPKPGGGDGKPAEPQAAAPAVPAGTEPARAAAATSTPVAKAAPASAAKKAPARKAAPKKAPAAKPATKNAAAVKPAAGKAAPAPAAGKPAAKTTAAAATTKKKTGGAAS